MKSIACVALTTLALVAMITERVDTTLELIPVNEFKTDGASDNDSKGLCCRCCGASLSCNRDGNVSTSYNPTLTEIFSGFAVTMVPESQVDKDAKYLCCCCCGFCLYCNRGAGVNEDSKIE